MNGKLAFSLFFLFLAFSVYAVKNPSWLTSPEIEFPSKDFLRAVGEAYTEKKAKSDALSEIALNFKANARVLNKSIQNLEIFSDDDRTNYSKSQTMHQEMEISSDVDLFCVQFTDSFYNKKSKKYSVLAYINRDEASKVLQAKIEPLRKEIKNLSSFAKAETEKLYIVFDYQRAKAYAELVQKYIEDVIVLKPSLINVYEKDLGLISEINSFSLAQKNKISFYASCEEKEYSSVVAGLASILEESGFIYSKNKKNADYAIDIKISFREEKYDIGKFVRPDVIASVINKKGEAVASYSKAYPRYGGYDNYESAYNLALVRIVQDFNENFLIAYRGYD